MSHQTDECGTKPFFRWVWTFFSQLGSVYRSVLSSMSDKEAQHLFPAVVTDTPLASGGCHSKLLPVWQSLIYCPVPRVAFFRSLSHPCINSLRTSLHLWSIYVLSLFCVCLLSPSCSILTLFIYIQG